MAKEVIISLELWKQPSIYIVSYPKTGRTWLRVMIEKSLCEMFGLPESEMLRTRAVTRHSGLPLTEFSHDGSGMQKGKTYSELSSEEFLQGQEGRAAVP